jgi:F0F1-type ATP synthase membrane subunit b/b'
VEKLIWPAINLFGLLGFLLYKTRAPFLDFVRGRRTDIFEGLNRSRARAEAAQARRKEVEAKMLTLDHQKARILADWKEKEATQTRAILDSSARILAQIRLEAEQNKKTLEEQTRISVERAFRRTVVAQAEKKIASALSAEVHARMAAGLVSRLEGGNA